MEQFQIDRFELFAPDGAVEDCLQMARSILVDDEYLLRPIRRGGHWPEYVVDVGGNVGAFAVAAEATFPGVRVLAVEPFGPLVESYRATARANGLHRYTVRQFAVGRQSGAATLRAIPGHYGGNFVAGTWGPSYADRAVDVEVRVEPLSEMLDVDRFPRIDLLKLDCEGAEADALEDLAATGWLHRTRWIRGEWHGQHNWHRARAALEATHVFGGHNAGPEQPLGFFLAHHRLDG